MKTIRRIRLANNGVQWYVEEINQDKPKSGLSPKISKVFYSQDRAEKYLLRLKG